MESVIDDNAILDYVEFRIFPSLNRYEAWAYSDEKKENVTSGVLEHLLRHSAEAKSLHSKGYNSKFILSSPKGIQKIKWFKKSTLIGFLQIIGSPVILDATESLKNEIFQLEATRTFHLSLYKKGADYQFKNAESGDSCSDGVGFSQSAEGTDSSKNELLRAVDLRLSALRGELIAAFDQAAGSRYDVEDIIDIQKFSENFGSAELSDALLKCIELRQGLEAAETSSREYPSELRVEYDASPAKAALLERQSSTDGEKSSVSSEEEQPSVERSRTLARSFSPRRSASPMRRIQIGRSGSRRSTAITIKSLNYFPARDKSFMTKDAASDSGDEQRSEGATQKSENNVKRMSVQDAIHLFESKQRDQTVDFRKEKSSGTVSIGPNKSVLRRWSSGVVEDTSPQDALVDSNMKDSQIDVGCEERASGKPEHESIPVVSEDKPIDHCSDVKLRSDEGACVSDGFQVESCLTESTGASDKLVTSSEWNQKKEAELNELLMQMMESKPVRQRTGLANAKKAGLHAEQRGDSYDRYKEKRDEKLQGSVARNATDKKKQLKAVQKVDTKKSQVASDAGKKPNPKKLQGQQKNILEPANRTGSSQVGIVKKAAQKTSALPATRKSRPSTSSQTVTGVSAAKAPGLASSAGKVPTRRKSETTPSVTQTSPKVEITPVQAKSVKSNQTDHKRSSGSATGKKQQSVSRTGKSAESKSQTSSDKLPSNTKPTLYSKVTKKSSVVPLESKPLPRKGSGARAVVNSATHKESSSDSQEPSRKSEDLTLVDKSLSELVIQKEEGSSADLGVEAIKESGSPGISPQKIEKGDFGGQMEPVCVDIMHRRVEELEQENEEEPTISPTAWVEIEEPENHCNTSMEHVSQIVDSPVRVSALSPRVRHSLSQMLLEETNEHDVVDWGTAENPQPLASLKDAPKGFKRLLKFARKSKTDTNSTGWSSPSAFSGDDDTEDPRSVNKRSSEKLPNKGAQRPKNSGHQKIATGDEKSGKSKFSSQSFQRKRQETNVSAPAKARSFFSLSAFKSSK